MVRYITSYQEERVVTKFQFQPYKPLVLISSVCWFCLLSVLGSCMPLLLGLSFQFVFGRLYVPHILVYICSLYKCINTNSLIPRETSSIPKHHLQWRVCPMGLVPLLGILVAFLSRGHLVLSHLSFCISLPSGFLLFRGVIFTDIIGGTFEINPATV